MARTLALFEVGTFFAVACLLFLSAQPSNALWLDSGRLLAQAVVVTIACLVSFYYNDLYDLRIVRSLAEFAPRLLQAFAISFFILAALYVIFPGAGVDARAFLTLQVVMASLILTGRAVCYGILRGPRFSEKVLLLGESALSAKIMAELEAAPFLRYRIPGIISDDPAAPAKPAALAPLVLGDVENAAEIIQEHRPSRVVIALGERRGRLPMWSLLASCLNDVIVEDGVSFYERITKKLAIESLNPSDLLYSQDFRKPRSQLFVRRLVSWSIALLGLLMTAPLMVLIAIVVKLDSKGPVFFAQKRVGLGGKPFQLFKFRTMHARDEASNDSVWHREDKLRITRSGKWLRALRLDELPQFINILIGDMDLVGPRPEMAENVPEMTREIPYYSLRTFVRPGVTGWAQTRYRYALTLEEVKEKLRYDLYYVKHMSIALDAVILADTVKTLLFSRGT